MRVTISLLLFFSLVTVAAIAILRPQGDDNAVNAALLVLPAGVAISSVVAFFLARRGRPRLGAGLVMVLSYLAIVNYMLVSQLGIRSHSTALLVLLIIVAALLIGFRAGLWVAGGTILTAIAMYLLEGHGLIVEPEAVRNLRPVNILVAYTILFLATGAILFLFSKTLHEALRAASVQELHLRQLIELAPFGYVLHRDGNVLMANRIAAKARGFKTAQELVGMSIYDLLPAEQRAYAGEKIAAAKAGVLPGNQPSEYRWPDKHGRMRRVESFTMRLDLADGPALLTVMRDVTQERETTAALAVAKEQAEAASRAKSQFLTNMSHEIRTPLNGVLGMADLLNSTSLSGEQRRFCDAITASGRALRDLLGDILDLAKIEAGKVELEHDDFELARMLQELETAYRELAAARGNRFAMRLALPPASRFSGDAMRLRQVLTNLLGNAVKFTENGTVELSAEGMPAREGDQRTWIRFTVRDSGVGMSDETMAKLFNPFSQADSTTTRQYGGTGLGLSITKHLVDLMGGTIGISSAPDAGAEFRVDIPLSAPRAAKVDGRLTAAAQTGQSLRILLVEDNDINQEVACAMLERAGHQVELAGDGAAALRKWAPGKYDCVLMDCQMPVMDGFETARLIRAQEVARGAKRTPIVALTANAMTGDRERCLAAGMDDFLSKPFDAESLLDKIAHRASAPAREVPSVVPCVSFDATVFDQLAQVDRNDPDFLGALLTRFLDAAPGLIATVATASPETAEESLRAAHTFKSTCARMGAPVLQGMAAEAETAAREGRFEAACAHGEAMRTEFERVASLMREYAERLKKVRTDR